MQWLETYLLGQFFAAHVKRHGSCITCITIKNVWANLCHREYWVCPPLVRLQARRGLRHWSCNGIVKTRCSTPAHTSETSQIIYILQFCRMNSLVNYAHMYTVCGKKVTPYRQCAIEMSNLNLSWWNYLHLFVNIAYLWKNYRILWENIIWQWSY